MSSVVQPSSLADHSHSLSSLYLPPAAVASLPTGLLHLDGFDSLNLGFTIEKDRLRAVFFYGGGDDVKAELFISLRETFLEVFL